MTLGKNEDAERPYNHLGCEKYKLYSRNLA